MNNFLPSAQYTDLFRTLRRKLHSDMCSITIFEVISNSDWYFYSITVTVTELEKTNLVLQWTFFDQTDAEKASAHINQKCILQNLAILSTAGNKIEQLIDNSSLRPNWIGHVDSDSLETRLDWLD